MRTVRIALVGDFNPAVIAHQAIPRAIALAAAEIGVVVTITWLPTDALAAAARTALEAADAVWCVPGSPYASRDGALRAIRFARERAVPFLGTCGGFQHALLEYAGNVLGLAAAHAELEPTAVDPLIVPLSCGLVETEGVVLLTDGTRLRDLYGTAQAREAYHCRYGVSPRHAAALFAGDLRVSARDTAGEVRGVELVGHPFYVATLYQPERAALGGVRHPVPQAFVAAAVRAATGQPEREEE